MGVAFLDQSRSRAMSQFNLEENSSFKKIQGEILGEKDRYETVRFLVFTTLKNLFEFCKHFAFEIYL